MWKKTEWIKGYGFEIYFSDRKIFFLMKCEHSFDYVCVENRVKYREYLRTHVYFGCVNVPLKNDELWSIGGLIVIPCWDVSGWELDYFMEKNATANDLMPHTLAPWYEKFLKERLLGGRSNAYRTNAHNDDDVAQSVLHGVTMYTDISNNIITKYTHSICIHKSYCIRMWFGYIS